MYDSYLNFNKESQIVNITNETPKGVANSFHTCTRYINIFNVI